MAASFEEFFESLGPLRQPAPVEEVLSEGERGAVEALQELSRVDRRSLAGVVSRYPEALPLLASCVGLSREQLLGEMKFRLGTAGLKTLARDRPQEVVETLDDAFSLVEAVDAQMAKDWTFADVLAERRLWSGRRASSSIATGRSVEDAAEEVIKRLGVRYEMRTAFEGLGGRREPCDFAIPAGGAEATVVGAAKGFDSTGSKLTDAVREVEAVANARLPEQFVVAIVDGIGWLRRQADLKRIHDLYEGGRIDGLYTLGQIDRFAADLERAVRSRGLI
jgi:hypothetical protein